MLLVPTPVLAWEEGLVLELLCFKEGELGFNRGEVIGCSGEDKGAGRGRDTLKKAGVSKGGK